MAQRKIIRTELQPLDKFLDTSGDAGTSGQVLSSTATGINWIDGSAIPGGGGNVTGTGVAGQVAYWTTSTNIANNAGMSFANDQMQLDGLSGADGYDLPYDQNPGYSNMSAGGFGILFREASDNYILGNCYFYRTGNANTFRAKYTSKGATSITSGEGGYNFETAPANTTAPHNLTFSSRMVIRQGGEVIIGATTTDTDVKLRVTQSANQWTQQIKSAYSYGLSIDTSASSNIGPGVLQMYTYSGGGFYVRNDSKVGIGTTSVSNLISLKGPGNNYATSAAVKFWDSLYDKGWYVGTANNYAEGDFYI